MEIPEQEHKEKRKAHKFLGKKGEYCLNQSWSK
jgi:hypothetical protein